MSTIDMLREFKNLGCSDQFKIGLACRVFQDLENSMVYSKVDKIYNDEIDLIYLTGCQDDKSHIIIPLLSTQDFNMYKLERIQLKLEELHKECILHIAICDAASNVLYYTITQGFVDDPKNWQEKN